MSYKIMECLRDEKLREKVAKALKEIYIDAVTVHQVSLEGREDHDYPFAKDWTCAWFNLGYHGIHIGEEDIYGMFQKYVFAKIERPNTITIYELYDELMSLAGIDPKYFPFPDFDEIYAAFISKIDNDILSYRKSPPFLVCNIESSYEVEGAWMEFGRAMQEAIDEQKSSGIFKSIDTKSFLEINKDLLLWNGNSIWVKAFLVKTERETEEENKYSLHAEITGWASKVAFEKINKEIQSLVPSVIRSLSFLYPTDEPASLSQNLIPMIKSKKFLEEKAFYVRKCIDYFYLIPSTKDNFERRIHNSICLLIEADRQTNNAVGLSLSFAAIEALIGRNEDNISSKLAERIAALFEPELSERSKAEKFVIDMYNFRSRVLHGEQTQSDDIDFLKARHLAAGVLFEVIFRQDLLKRAGFPPETPEDLIKRLKEKKYDDKRLLGIEDSNVKELWSNKKQK